MHRTKQAKAELLLGKYFDRHEASVKRGIAEPFTGVERALIERLLQWVCHNYNVEAR